MTKLAEELVKSLYGMGVRYAFGIPGGPSIPYLEAMRNNGIEFITVANEQSAGMMADVVGRLTGIPGVCHATFGPGATNLSTGIGGALLDRSPLIAFTTEVKDEDLGRRVQMNVDHQAIFQPITKWTTRLYKDNFEYTLRNAFEIATGEIPGPVHIGLPVNIADEEVEPADFANILGKKIIPSPETASLEEMKRMLEKAKKPVLAIGLTTYRYGLHRGVREFLNKNPMPVVFTPMAKGIVPESHPAYAGVLFHAKSEYTASIYRNADLVIGLGYDSIEFNYESWMPDVPLIHMDTESLDITPEYKGTLEVRGSLEDSVTYLNSLELPIYDWDLKEIEGIKDQMFKALVPETNTFTPSDAIVSLQELMPKDGILTSDVGAHLHLIGQLWKVPEEGQLIMTNGWSTMGFGIPSAIAAKLCRPSRTVVCITGDAGFLMNCGELMIARKKGIHVVVIVFCDRNLSLIEVKQGWKNVVQYATDLAVGEYFDADKFLGIPVFKATNEDEMKLSLEKAFAESGPVVVEAVVDGSVYKDLITRNYK